MKKVFQSSITGEFVSKQYAKENPDTTFENTVCDLKKELTEFAIFAGIPQSKVSEYLKQSE